MNKIEVGEYVRTKYNGIKRIDIIFENKTVNKYGYETGSDWDGKWYSYIKTTEIVNHSKNIIDLIEVEDYVNGRKIERINDYGEHKRADFNLDFDDCDAVYNKDIKTILTKEQYNQNCYRLED